MTDYFETAKTWASLPEETKVKLLALQAALQDFNKDALYEEDNLEPKDFE